MKKLLAIMVLGLLWCNVGFAEIRLIEEKTVKGKEFRYTIATVCVDGYKFVVGRRMQVQSMVQFYKSIDQKPVPAKC